MNYLSFLSIYSVIIKLICVWILNAHIAVELLFFFLSNFFPLSKDAFIRKFNLTLYILQKFKEHYTQYTVFLLQSFLTSCGYMYSIRKWPKLARDSQEGEHPQLEAPARVCIHDMTPKCSWLLKSTNIVNKWAGINRSKPNMHACTHHVDLKSVSNACITFHTQKVGKPYKNKPTLTTTTIFINILTHHASASCWELSIKRDIPTGVGLWYANHTYHTVISTGCWLIKESTAGTVQGSMTLQV